MAFFRGLFSRHKQKVFENHMKGIIHSLENTEKERAREIHERLDFDAIQGMLPPPDIVVDYDCECGVSNAFHMKNLNLIGGMNVQCANCAAVLHVPATVLDHTEYWAAGGGAALVRNWRDQMAFIRHRRR